jgi:hypothetical protein
MIPTFHSVYVLEFAECQNNTDRFNLWMDAAQVGPVQFTMGPVPSYPRLDSALQIFSVKVVELKGTMMCWPIDVYGFIAVRDSVDRNRNYSISLSVPGATTRRSTNRYQYHHTSTASSLLFLRGVHFFQFLHDGYS